MIIGNWKMYKTVDEALEFVKTLAPLVAKSQARVGIAVPYTTLMPVATFVEHLEVPLSVGAQNVSDAEEGAFTGEVSGKMLRDAGAQFVIVGHSERRQLFHESNAFVNRKVKRALADGLHVIVCVGETLEEKEAGLEESVLLKQITESLDGVENLENITLAYEPIWAIGTGKVAKSQDAQKVHAFCRKVIAEKWGEEAAKSLTIQYGGSVKPENAAELLSKPDVDGLLVGGASLAPASFGQIVNSYKESS